MWVAVKKGIVLGAFFAVYWMGSVAVACPVGWDCPSDAKDSKEQLLIFNTPRTVLADTTNTQGMVRFAFKTSKTSGKEHAFWVDVREVSLKAYMECVAYGVCSRPLAAKGGHTKDLGDDAHVLESATFEQARRYCQWLGKDLPTRAEWERVTWHAEATRMRRIKVRSEDAVEWALDTKESGQVLVSHGKDTALSKTRQSTARRAGFRCVRQEP